ncbi:hypothetical protein SBV1_200007 [Verrucomicrobia bacterium]|nr:hypothetical protein SBV1_200007 [Verrucomicrobiota bacterium]
MRAIDLVVQVLESGGFASARAFLDGPLDVVIRHVRRPALEQYHAQARIHVRVCPADFGRDCDFLAQLGKDLPTLGVDRPFKVFYFCPFTVARHKILNPTLKLLSRLAPPQIVSPSFSSEPLHYTGASKSSMVLFNDRVLGCRPQSLNTNWLSDRSEIFARAWGIWGRAKALPVVARVGWCAGGAEERLERFLGKLSTWGCISTGLA